MEASLEAPNSSRGLYPLANTETSLHHIRNEQPPPLLVSV